VTPADGIDAALRRAGLPPLPRTAWLAIDLDCLVANLRVLRAALPRGVRVEPVVKADAYGHGAVPTAIALAAAGADGFGVATLDEAQELREAGIGLPILVLYPVPPAAAELAAAGAIAVTLGEETLIEQTLAALPARLAAPLDVHLEIETGLGRGGVDPTRAAVAARRLGGDSRIRPIGVWTHLGTPGDPIRSAAQHRRFDEALAGLAAAGWPAGRVHVAASGGILAAAAPPHDAVRPGLSLYGLAPDGLPVAAPLAAAAGALAPVLSLHARPVRVADLPTGAGVGYGNGFVTDRPSRIATLPIGYADGYRRAWGARARVLVRGNRAALVGGVAMDAVMVDVTDVPGSPVTVGDEFVLLGEQGADRIDAFELAHIGTTISWEVLAGMARRLPRVYYAGAVPTALRTLTEGREPWHSAGINEPRART